MNSTSQSWELRSSKGGELARWDLCSTAGLGESLTLVCDLSLRASQWGEGPEPTGVTLAIRRISIRRSTLVSLEKHLRAWASLPLAELARTPLEYSTEAGGTFDNAVRLTFAARDDLISERHPCVTIEYQVGKLVGRLTFVTDQSCIRLLCDDIAQTLQSLEGAA